MKIEELEYLLPPELIAQYPEPIRDRSRLLILDRRKGTLQHRTFQDLPDSLVPGDLLVLNDTRVVPARLRGRKVGGGGAVEVLLLKEVSPDRWEVLARPGKRLRPGSLVSFAGDELQARFFPPDEESGNRSGRWTVEFSSRESVKEAIARYGELPLPPYIKRRPPSSPGPAAEPDAARFVDGERYQTVYARNPGAVAAPTAGLHFTHPLIEEIRSRGIRLEFLTLHVGTGTFRPVRADRVEDHRLESESYEIGTKLVEAVKQTRQAGNRVLAVGTTTTRALEAAGDQGRQILSGPGLADLFIYPGYRFRVIDGLVTNFHLPRSTLLALVCAFGGRKAVFDAYQSAIRERYRFYSYGDAMLIV